MQVTHTFRDSGTLVRQADTVHVQLIMGSCKTLQEVEFRESSHPGTCVSGEQV